ncbi:MAG: aminopeptidase P family protein [Clostridiales bacterium]|nr:aminopeptidase P family protein [Clostridiales bacterium]
MIQTNGKKVFASMQNNADALFVTCGYLMRYITGFAPEDGAVVVDKNGVTLYTDSRYIESAEKLFEGTEVTPTLWAGKTKTDILKGYQIVAVSFQETSHAEFLSLQKIGVELVNADDWLPRLMEKKNDWELSRIERACEIAEDAFLQLLPQIKEGMTETEVGALLEYNMRKLGAQGLSFETIVAFGAHASVPHYETGDTKLCFGDEILIDFGCKVDGYCSDITRTFLFGDDGKHEEFKEAYNHVLRAHELAKANIVSGMTGKEADAIARNYLKANGLGDLFTHSLGHGIGLNVHEKPAISPKSEQVLEDGMVFSDEPGVYKAGEYGIRIEDTVTLKNGKIKSFMSKTDKNLIIL